jgi:uncharacterized protein (UPF0332 family)
MEERVRAYAQLRLERAHEELETVRQNIAHGHLRAAVSRAYYAIFYMASAALFTQSIQRAKHAGVEAAFSQYLVKTGQIEPEFSRLYQRARRQREEADYAEDLVIDETTAKQILTDAERFVERIERYLREQRAL